MLERSPHDDHGRIAGLRPGDGAAGRAHGRSGVDQSGVYIGVHASHRSWNFALRRSALQFEPVSGKIGDEVAIDAASGESGSASRDKRTHNEILESAKYPEIVFRPDRTQGKLAAQAPRK
jgi:hypothetical protein